MGINSVGFSDPGKGKQAKSQKSEDKVKPGCEGVKKLAAVAPLNLKSPINLSFAAATIAAEKLSNTDLIWGAHVVQAGAAYVTGGVQAFQMSNKKGVMTSESINRYIEKHPECAEKKE